MRRRRGATLRPGATARRARRGHASGAHGTRRRVGRRVRRPATPVHRALAHGARSSTTCAAAATWRCATFAARFDGVRARADRGAAQRVDAARSTPSIRRSDAPSSVRARNIETVHAAFRPVGRGSLARAGHRDRASPRSTLARGRVRARWPRGVPEFAAHGRDPGPRGRCGRGDRLLAPDRRRACPSDVVLAAAELAERGSCVRHRRRRAPSRPWRSAPRSCRAWTASWARATPTWPRPSCSWCRR